MKVEPVVYLIAWGILLAIVIAGLAIVIAGHYKASVELAETREDLNKVIGEKYEFSSKWAGDAPFENVKMTVTDPDSPEHFGVFGQRIDDDVEGMVKFNCYRVHPSPQNREYEVERHIISLEKRIEELESGAGDGTLHVQTVDESLLGTLVGQVKELESKFNFFDNEVIKRMTLTPTVTKETVISLQKEMTQLRIKVDNLSTQKGEGDG